MISFSAPLQLWTGADGNSHFMTIPDAPAAEIRLESSAAGARRAFGSVRVECRIGDVIWRTSVFPQKSGGYFLPVKADICRGARLVVGEIVTVKLEIV
jgi:hypothetical protein